MKKKLSYLGAAALFSGSSLLAQDGGNVAEKGFSLLRLYKQGGDFMWPILILTAVALGFIVERLVFFAISRLGSKEFINRLEHNIEERDLDAVEELIMNEKNKIAVIIRKGLSLKKLGYERVEKTLSVAASVEVALLERGLGVISAIANIVPMLGFLGTVTGMITAFNDIAAADQVSAKIVAGGIKEALLTTAFGLIAAIPILLIYNYFVNRIESFITNIERLSSDIVEKLIKGGSQLS
jgi:biopolymer transport protein ExbB